MKLMTATIMAGLMLLTMNAKAVITPGTSQVALTLGASNPLSYTDINGQRAEFGETGPSLGFNALYQLLPNLAVGADLSFKRLGERDIRTGIGVAQVQSSAWTMMAIGRGDFLPASDIRPYVMTGLGVGGVKREVRYAVSPAFDRDTRSGGAALALGTGVDFDITPAIVAGAELRWNYIDTDHNKVGTNSARTLDLNFKVGYKF